MKERFPGNQDINISNINIAFAAVFDNIKNRFLRTLDFSLILIPLLDLLKLPDDLRL